MYEKKIKTIETLDFSRFHPMDHSWWQCWSRNRYEKIYGKTWTHMKYYWIYVRPMKNGDWENWEKVEIKVEKET